MTICIDCKTSIDNSNGQRKRCPNCVKLYARIYMKKYYKNNPEKFNKING